MPESLAISSKRPPRSKYRLTADLIPARTWLRFPVSDWEHTNLRYTLPRRVHQSQFSRCCASDLRQVRTLRVSLDEERSVVTPQKWN